MTEKPGQLPDRVEIGIDRIVEILKAGVRRTAAFMGLGVNAAIDPEFNKVALPGSITNMHLLPEISEEMFPEIKREFAIWVQAGGFRELCESLEQYLTAIYRAGLYMRASQNGKIPRGTMIHIPKTFLHRGIRVKLDMLLADFGVGPQYPDHLSSFWDARNCLTHRRGIVGEEDVCADGVLRLKWLGLDMLFVSHDGTERLLGLGFEPFETGEGGSLAVRLAERVKEYRVGEQLALSPHDLHEICWSCLRASDQVVASLLQYAEARGVTILRSTNPMGQAVEPQGSAMT